MELDKGMELARELVDNGKVAKKSMVCSEKLQLGEGYYESHEGIRTVQQLSYPAYQSRCAKR
ncbi:MAG: hypothetical protein ACLUD2_18310 [Clostridium sp.]